MDSLNGPSFHRERHIKYWLRCAKTLLPSQYTPNDSNRITLAFFIVSALDVLDILNTKVTLEERESWINWIYHCQLPDGGFRGFPGTAFGDDKRGKDNAHWDPANVPATFFALMTLIILGDDLSRVKREECLEWLPKLQRENGSFGETLGENGGIEGGNDLRFCCCAAGIRYVLEGRQSWKGGNDVRTFQVDKMIQFIASCQTYEGGFAEGAFHEAHSGLTYCAIGALSFLGKLSDGYSKEQEYPNNHGVEFEQCLRCLVSRQTTYIEETDELDEADGEATRATQINAPPISSIGYIPHLGHLSIDDASACQDSPVTSSAEQLKHAGFNGRANKVADTCYCFWNLGSLAILHRIHLIDPDRLRRYLLGKVQHIVGGFGKGVGEPPDVLHAYLGLASLALIDESSLTTMDPTLCISKRAFANLSRVSWWNKPALHASDLRVPEPSPTAKIDGHV